MKTKLVLTTTASIVFSLLTYAQQETKAYISVEFGYGYRTASAADNITDELRDYNDELRSGFNIDTHLGVFIKPNWGLGLTYNRFQSNNQIRFLTPIIIEGLSVSSASDRVRINFIAPEFLYRSLSVNEKHSFISTLSIGYLSSKNDATINDESLELSGGTIGLGLGFSYSYHITKSVAIGAGISFITGTLSKVEISNGILTETVTLPDDEKENLSRININGGIRFFL